MDIIVTGGAGFIGSYVVERLLKEGHNIIVIDNLSSGSSDYIHTIIEKEKIVHYHQDLTCDDFARNFIGTDMVWHIAANPDVRLSATDPGLHFEQNVVATFNVLEAMRFANVKRIAFTSSSAVYGDATTIPTPESYNPSPISVYGASKLASEALINSYCHSFNMQAWIFRLANVVGGRAKHGVIPDFIKHLLNTPEQLNVLGNGEQTKSYIYVLDCVSAMFAALKCEEVVNTVNIGTDDWTSVREVARIVSAEMKLTPELHFSGGKRGWTGDATKMLLDISKLKGLGWCNKFRSPEAVMHATRVSHNELRSQSV